MNLHIFVSVSVPKINSVIIALYGFKRFGDLGRTISEAQHRSRSTAHWTVKLRGAVLAPPQASGREAEGSNLVGGSSFLARTQHVSPPTPDLFAHLDTPARSRKHRIM